MPMSKASTLPSGDASAHARHGDLPREIVEHILLAAVGQLDRRTLDLPGDRNCMPHAFVLEPVSEASADIENVDEDLPGFHIQ